MAVPLRQGARRLGVSVLQRTQAALTSPAVSEERCRQLVPRRMRMYSTAEQAQEKIAREIQQKKEELYDATAKAHRSFWTRSWANGRLLRHLSADVKPRPSDSQWRWLQFSRRANGVLRTAGLVSLTGVVASACEYLKGFVEDSKVAGILKKKEAV